MGFVFNGCTSDDLVVQQRCGWTGAKGRLRREDCKFVKHDKLFSKWKILVGPSDATEQMKDGIRRLYNLHNLPASTQFGPGVYELGVTSPSWSQAPHMNQRTLKREDVIPVYIGHAADIRRRLQKYGLAGAHLEPASAKSSSELYQGDHVKDPVGSRSPRNNMAAGSCGPRLFSEVFALGSSIAFRWAHTDSKVVAEQVESELLAVFDYAWNKGTSGTRRSRDILAKLFMAWPAKDVSSCNLIFPGKRSSFWALPCGRQSAVGIKVALRKPQDKATTSVNSSKSVMTNLCFLMTMQPPKKVASLDSKSCGVVTGTRGSTNAPPLRGLQHYEIQRLTGSPRQINMGRMKVLPTEPVETRSWFLPRGFLGSREIFFATKTKTCCKEVDSAPKDEKLPVERRRHNSLSFNTWMKGETDQRVHDSSNMKEDSSSGTTLVQTQAKRRVQHLGSKYASARGNDSKRR